MIFSPPAPLDPLLLVPVVILVQRQWVGGVQLGISWFQDGIIESQVCWYTVTQKQARTVAPSYSAATVAEIERHNKKYLDNLFQ